MYKFDMSKESTKVMLPKGLRKFRITACEERESKSRNPMFVFTLLDIGLDELVEVYATAVEKKRWFLKSILQACNIKSDEEGVFEWDIPDVLDKFIMGYVEHYLDTWINRDNLPVETEKWKISKIEAIDSEQEMELAPDKMGPDDNPPIFNEKEGTIE